MYSPSLRLRAEVMEDRILHSADIAPLLMAGAAADSFTTQPLLSASADAQVQRSEIVFVDASVPDAASLLADLQAQQVAGRPIEIIVIGAGQDGVALISATLAGRSDITAVHVLAHGGDGALQLGSATLDAQTLLQRAGEISAWGAALATDADLLLYGCDLAQTGLGQSLVRDLAALTGADVAASTDLTGAAAAGGNWTLEYQTGAIEAGAALSSFAQFRWAGLLATYIADPTKADGTVGSLRWAIDQANANPGPDEIQLLAGTHLITVTNGGVSDDLNARGDLDVLGDTTFVGTTGTATDTVVRMASGNLDRVFHLFGTNISFRNLTIDGGNNSSAGGGILGASSSVQLSLTNVVVRNNTSNSGGGISVSGTTTLTDVILRDNSANNGAGIDSSGTLTMTRVEAFGNVASGLGGAIKNAGQATLTDGWIHDNSARSGGGISMQGGGNTLTMTNVTLNNNSATQFGGGFYGGGGTLTASNVTISGNTAGTVGSASGYGGGIYVNTTGYSLSNATIADNWATYTGGGVWGNGSVVTLRNTILSNNRVGAGNTAQNANMAQLSAGYNITTDSSAGLTQSTDRSTTVAALNLGALAANGGFAPTRALLVGSTAINVGNPSAPATDQRGVTRAGTPDIGAYEYNPGNAAPTISAVANQVVNEDASLTVNFTIGDAETPAGSLVVTASSGNTALLPGSGIVLGGSGSSRSVTLTPAPNANSTRNGGPVTVTLSVSDGTNITTRSFTLTVNPMPDAPVAVDDTASTAAATAVVIAVLGNDYDVDGDSFVVNSATLVNPADGFVSFDASTITFTPAVSGTVLINYTIRDSTGLVSNTATVTVSVGPNNPPTGANQTIVVLEDGSRVITEADLGYSDLDSNLMAAVRIESLPGLGSLRLDGTPIVSAGLVVSAADLAAGRLSFAPAPDGNGSPYTSFEFRVQDSVGAFAAAANTLSVNVTPVADPPRPADDVASTPINQAVNVRVLDNDSHPDGAAAAAGMALTAVWLDDPSQGTVAISTALDPRGSVLFTPGLSVSGPVLIHYTVSDAAFASANARLTVTVGANTAPTSANHTATLLEDGSYAVSAADIAFADADAGQTMSGLRIDSLPGVGSLTLAGVAVEIGDFVTSAQLAGDLVFRPAADGNGVGYDSFGFSVVDSGGQRSGSYTFTFDVTPVNDAPVASAASASTGENAVLNASVPAATDIDGSVASYALASGLGAGNGSLVFSADGSYVFNPGTDFDALAAGASRIVNFSYVAIDDLGLASAPATVTLTVTGTNDAPVASAASASTGENAVLNASVPAATDIDGSVASYALASGLGAGNGSLVFSADGSYVFNPGTDFDALAAGASRIVNFSYVAIDDLGLASAPATVTLTVTGTNDAPVASAASASGAEDALLPVLLAGGDVDGSVASFTVQTLPANGTLYLDAARTTAVVAGTPYAASSNALTLYFSPAPDWNGSTTFDFVATDDLGLAGAVASASLTVTPVNDAPLASGSATLAAVNEDTLSPAGATVASLFSANFSDPTDAGNPAQNQFAGVAVRGETVLASQGRWQYSTNGGASWASFGALDDANAVALATTDRLRFLPGADFNGTPNSLSVRLIDNSASLTGGASIDVSVNGGTSAFSSGTVALATSINAVNDAPLNGVPGAQFTARNTPLVFSTANGNAISVSDVDATVLQVTLGALGGAGTLTLATTAGLTFSSGSGSGDASMTFSGGIASINAALNGLRYTPTTGFTGTALLQITSADLGASGSGGPLTDTDLVSVAITDAALWLSTEGFATSSAGSGNLTWGDSQIVSFGNPNLALGSGLTRGTFSIAMSVYTLAADGDADVTGLHVVSRAVTVGTTNPISLQAGDVLFSVRDDETFGGVAVKKQDIVLFRPTTPGNYSAGSFQVVLRNPGGTGNDMRDFALVETATTVGGTALQAGDFLLVLEGSSYERNVSLFRPTTMATNPTGGTLSLLINGASTGLNLGGSKIWGLELVQQAVTLGGKQLAAGTLLLSLDGSALAGLNLLSVQAGDIFALDVTTTGLASTATASMVFRSADVGLTGGGERLDAIAIVQRASAAPVVNLGSGALTYTENDLPTPVAPAATVTDADSSQFGTGSLSAYLSANGSADDRLSIRNVGNGATQIGVVGSDVRYGGVLIGSFSGGGDGSTPLVVSLNANATLAATQALLRNITYFNVSEDPSTLPRTLSVVLADGSGGTSLASTRTINVIAVNDAAVLSADTRNLTETDAALSASGTLTISDVDSPATFVAQNGTAGSYGSFSIDAVGAWSYSASSAHDAFVAGVTYTDVFTVASADGTTTSVTINILGSNDAAVLSADTRNLTETDAALSASGTLTISDVDSPATFVAQSGTAGSYGSFSIDAAGAWSYSASSAHDAFVAGVTYTDVFTVASADGTTTSVTINILGSNDAAVLSADTRNLTETDAALSASGTLTISDVDSPVTFVAQSGTAGSYGSFSIDAAGAWSYSASSAHDAFVAGVTYTDVFTVASADGTTTSVTINILGSNDAAVLSADTRNLTETDAALSASGTLTISDVDSPVTFVAQSGTAGSYGSFSIDAAGAWSYSASSAHDAFVAGVTYTDVFTVASADGTTTSVTINILGSNDAAVLSADTRNLTETDAALSASGTLTISDVDSPVTFVAQSGTAGSYGSFSIDAAGAWSYSASSAHDAFVAGVTYTDVFTVASADGTTTSVTINILGSNDAPVFSAISAQAATQDQPYRFTLPAGTFTDADGSLSYSATLANGAALPAWLAFDAATQTFVGTPRNDDVGAITVRVTARDDSNASAVGDFTLTVANVNDAPVLAMPIADQSVVAGSQLRFQLPSATFIDIDVGDTLHYSATLANGSALPGWLRFDERTLAFTANPGIILGGTFIVRVTATDDSGAAAQAVFALVVAPAPVLVESGELDRPAAQPATAESLAPVSGVVAASSAALELPAMLQSAAADSELLAPAVTFESLEQASRRGLVDADGARSRHGSRADTVLAEAIAPEYMNVNLGSMVNLLGSDSLARRFDELQRQMLEMDIERQTLIASALAASSGLSVGYVVWLVRGGVLVSSMLSALPAWQMIDPLPVVAAAGAVRGRRTKLATDDADVERLFDDHRKPDPTPPPAPDAPAAKKPGSKEIRR